MNPDVFADDYAEARACFVAAARKAGAEIARHAHAARGPRGEALATDVARFGPRGAPAVLWFSSGTHGIEGFCGSAVQTAAIEAGLFADLPQGVAVLAVHAINPWGFAHERRVNEDNIDLNRNFIDHGAPYPSNPVYDAQHAALCPASWDAATRKRTADELEAAAGRFGAKEALEGVSQGQYDHPDGLFYGGRGPTWSNLTVARIARAELGNATAVASLDIHTGLGPHGYGEAIATTADPRALALLEQWHGGEARPLGAGSVSGLVTGALSDGLAAATGALVVPVALEFGTVERGEVRLALRADNWLHHHGDPASEAARAIKAQMRRAFYPHSEDWKRAVIDRTEEILTRTLSGLARLAAASPPTQAQGD